MINTRKRQLVFTFVVAVIQQSKYDTRPNKYDQYRTEVSPSHSSAGHMSSVIGSLMSGVVASSIPSCIIGGLPRCLTVSSPVCQQVSVQVSFAGVALWTVDAGIWTNTAVRQHVFL